MTAPGPVPASEVPTPRALAGLLLQAHWLIGDVAREVSGRRAGRDQLDDVAELCTSIAGALRRYAATLPGSIIEGQNADNAAKRRNLAPSQSVNTTRNGYTR